MEPRESRASTSTPRTRPAGGVRDHATASSQDGVRRSTRAHSNVEPPPPSTAESCKAPSSKPRSSSKQRSGGKASGSSEPQQWGVKGPRESLATLGSRIQAKMAEYEQLGKQLRRLREDLKFASYQVDHAAKSKRAGFSAKVRSLRKEVEELEQLRADIVAGGGMFGEKLLNDDRFANKQDSREVNNQDCQSEEEEMEEGEGGEEGNVSEGDMETGSVCATIVTPDPPLTLSSDYVNPAQVALPPSSEEDDDNDYGNDCSEGSSMADGGLLRAIVLQESPTRLENFSFGEDLGPEEKKKRKKGRKRKKTEDVQFVFSPFQHPGPAEKSVQGAGSPNLPDPVSVVERGQHGGNSSAPKMAAGGIVEKGHPPVRGEGVQAPENGGSVTPSGGGPQVEVGGIGSGAAGHPPVKGEVPCTSAVVGGVRVRPEGQLSPKSVSEAEPVSMPQETGQRSCAAPILKPATLIHGAKDLASPACKTARESAAKSISESKKVKKNGNVQSVSHDSADGRSCSSSADGVQERGASGVQEMGASGVQKRGATGEQERGASGVQERGESGIQVRSGSGMAERGMVADNSVRNKGPGLGSGSGSTAPPAVTASPRSYASITAGGTGGSPSPSGSGGHLQQRLLEALRRGDRSIQVEGRGEVDLSFYIERHGLGAFREQNGEVVWSLPTSGQESGRRNVVRLVWRGEDACPPRGKVVELLLQMEFRASDIFALIHPYGTSEFDISFVRPDGLELFWSNYEVVKSEPGWRDFAVKAISRQNLTKKVTVLTRNESLSCYDIMTWLRRYGDVTDMPKKNLDEHGIWSGAWTFSVKLKRSGSTVAHIPSAAFLGRDRIQVFYQGQPKLCHRCGSPTHFSAACTVQVCALCGGVGHLAASCKQIRCHLCGVLGHPFSRCPSAFARATVTLAGESRNVASAGVGTSAGEGATGSVRSKGPAKLRREANRRRSRELESSHVAGVASGPAPEVSPETAEALEEDVLDEETRRISREEGSMADLSDSSHYESVDEEGEERPKKKGSKGGKKRSEPSSPRATDQVPSGSLPAPPLIDLSNRYSVLDDISSPSSEGGGKDGVPDVGEPPGGTGPCPDGAVSSGDGAKPKPGGDGDSKMDLSESKKRSKEKEASSSGDEGVKKRQK